MRSAAFLEIIMTAFIIVFLVAMFTGRLPGLARNDTTFHDISELEKEKIEHQVVQPLEHQKKGVKIDTPPHDISELNKKKMGYPRSRIIERPISWINFYSSIKHGDAQRAAAYCILFAGSIIYTIGWWSMVIAAFKSSFGGGVFIIFFPWLGWLIFAFNDWEKVRKPTNRCIIGILIFFVGMYALRYY